MLLLEKVFQTINESGLDYCIQNKYEMMPEEIPSDIDMMYRNADESFLDLKKDSSCNLIFTVRFPARIIPMLCRQQ